MRDETKLEAFSEAKSLLAEAATHEKVRRGYVEPTARALDLALHVTKARVGEREPVELYTDEMHDELRTRLDDEKHSLPEVEPWEEELEEEDDRPRSAVEAGAVAPTYDADVAALTYQHVARTTPNKRATTFSQFKTLLAGLVAGDWLHCSGIHFYNEVIIKKALTGYAKITFDSTCKHTGQTTQGNYPCFWIPNGSRYLQLISQGMDVSNQLGGVGIVVYGPGDHIVIDGFKMHDLGTGGLGFLPVMGDLHDCFLRNEASVIARTPSYDPHAEKGSGIHGALTGDANYLSRNNVFAMYCHESGVGASKGGGSVLEIGGKGASRYNTVYVKGYRMLWVSKIQTGGNGVNCWGLMDNNVFKTIDVDQMMGFAMHSIISAQPGNVVAKGVATNACQNSRYRGQNPWMRKGGIGYTPGPFAPAP